MGAVWWGPGHHGWWSYRTPLNRQTDTIENITFPQLRWRAVKKCNNQVIAVNAIFDQWDTFVSTNCFIKLTHSYLQSYFSVKNMKNRISITVQRYAITEKIAVKMKCQITHSQLVKVVMKLREYNYITIVWYQWLTSCIILNYSFSAISIKKDRNMKARDRTNANWETAITKNLHKSSVKRAERDFVCSKIFILFTLQLKNI